MATVFETLYGTADDDSLTVHGVQQGDDYVYYATIHGGDGNDFLTLDYDPGTVACGFFGDGGNDTLYIKNLEASNIVATLSGGDGDDTIFMEGRLTVADGGSGYDKLCSSPHYRKTLDLDQARITGFEELVIVGQTYVEDFDLHTFQKLSVYEGSEFAALTFSHAVDLSDYPIDTNDTELRLTGSKFDDRFDLSSYTSHFAVDGLGGDDYLRGTANDDFMSGGSQGYYAGHDTVLGMGGDDVILYVSGDGIINGGEGDDTLKLTAWGGKIAALAQVQITSIETLDFGSNPLRVNATGADFSSVNNVKGRAILKLDARCILDGVTFAEGCDMTIEGSKGSDTIFVSNSQGNLEFYGKDGDDDVRCDGGTMALWGNAGNDRLVARSAAALLSGGTGDDVIKGGEKADLIDSGIGRDRISGGGGHDSISLVTAEPSDAKIVDAGIGNDSVTIDAIGIKGGGILDGGEGIDTLAAGGDLSGHSVRNIEMLQMRAEKLTAYAAVFDSFDFILAKKLNFWETSDNLQLEFSRGGTFTWHDGSEVIYATLVGSEQTDIIDLSAAPNQWHIFGNGGDDRITGSSFDDSMDGGAGRDILTGGRGYDRFFFSEGYGRDVITDFHTLVDNIDLRGIDGLDDYNDLMMHIHQVGDNVDLIFGEDTLTITDFKVTKFNIGDIYY